MGDARVRAGWRRARGLLLVCVLLLSACSTMPRDGALDDGDPLEGFNRGVFAFNDVMDQAVLRPVSWVYRTVVPAPLRVGVRNFLQWISSPLTVANTLFQGDVEQAGVTVSRFFVNSLTLGFGDAATGMGLVHRQEDFGQTLGVHGVGSGPYLVLPVFGPSNARDTAGRVVDFLIDPLNNFGHREVRDRIRNGRLAISSVAYRDQNFEAIDDQRAGSIDYYAAVRSVYRQQRAALIRNGALPDDSPLDEGVPANGAPAPAQ